MLLTHALCESKAPHGTPQGVQAALVCQLWRCRQPDMPSRGCCDASMVSTTLWLGRHGTECRTIPRRAQPPCLRGPTRYPAPKSSCRIRFPVRATMWRSAAWGVQGGNTPQCCSRAVRSGRGGRNAGLGARGGWAKQMDGRAGGAGRAERAGEWPGDVSIFLGVTKSLKGVENVSKRSQNQQKTKDNQRKSTMASLPSRLRTCFRSRPPPSSERKLFTRGSEIS